MKNGHWRSCGWPWKSRGRELPPVVYSRSNYFEKNLAIYRIWCYTQNKKKSYLTQRGFYYKFETYKAFLIKNQGKEKKEIPVYTIGKINRDIFKCVTADIMTDEVVITESQIQHIRDKHPNDYERFAEYFREIIAEPDYIIEAEKPYTALILKEIKIEKKVFKTILRLATSKDNPEYKNSIITFMKINEREWNRLLKNKKVLYKRT